MTKDRIKKSRIIKILQGALIPIVVLVLWEKGARGGNIDTSILSSPSEIVLSWKQLLQQGKYQEYLFVSIDRFAKGFFFGTLCGLSLGTFLGLSKRANKYLVAIIGLLRSIPLIAWVPIVILSMGVGEVSKDVLVAIGCFWAVFLNTSDGIKGVDTRLTEVSYVLEKSLVTKVTRVVLPAAFPNIITGLREGFSNSWRSIVAAEMIGASSGIGFIISYSREISRPDLMFIGLLTVGIIGLTLDLVLLKLQAIVLRRYFK